MWSYCETAIWIVDCFFELETCYHSMSTSARGGMVRPYALTATVTVKHTRLKLDGKVRSLLLLWLWFATWIHQDTTHSKGMQIWISSWRSDLWSAVFRWPLRYRQCDIIAGGKTEHLHSATLHSVSLYLPCLLYRSPLQSQASPRRDTRWVTACNWNAGLTDAIFISSWKECLWGPS